MPSDKPNPSRKGWRHRLILLVLGLALVLPRVGAAQPPAPAGALSSPSVTIDFNGVDIRVFIKFISELTQKNFIIDNRVKGKVNILSPGKITVAEAFKVFESVLEVHGFAAVESGEVTKIIPLPAAAAKSVETRVDRGNFDSEDKVVTQLIPLEYADVNQVKALLGRMVSKGSILLAYAPTNTLIITDVYSNIRRLITLIEVIDVRDVGRQITVFPVQYAQSGKLVRTLETLFRSKGRAGKQQVQEQQPRFVADERTNTVIALASQADTEKIREMIHVMDQAVPRSDARIRVIYLEHANAEDLAKVLQSLTGKSQAKQDPNAPLAVPTVSERVKITHDKSTNSLIIMADKEDHQVLADIVKKLDIPRPMVYIEALIMEVRDTADFAVGTEWTVGTDVGTIDGRDAVGFGGFTSSSKKGVQALPTISNNSATLANGFNVGIMTQAITVGGVKFPGIAAALKALKSNEDVRIISTPQIMTTDNEEAEINVGENIPYLTRSSTGDANYNTYEYKDVGVTLKITPQISQGRVVRLKIYQKVEKLTNISTVEASATPTTLKRTAETTVVVKDTATVVIGGLIGEDLSAGDYAVPCLGDIPGLGYLFKSTAKNSVQTNLYIFLTPRIIGNPAEAEAVFREKQAHMESMPETLIPLHRKKEEPASKPQAFGADGPKP